MDLEKLLTALRDGEDWAGPALVTLLMPMLLRYVEEIGSDMSQSEREEAVESAVLRSVDRIEQYNPDQASFPSWVRGFLRYAVADCRRKKGGIAEVPLDEALDLVSEDPAESVDTDEATHGLVWPLLQLDVTDQVIIALRDFEGLTYAQCAERIGGGVTEGACRVRHFRALKRLRDLLALDPKYQQYFEGVDDND